MAKAAPIAKRKKKLTPKRQLFVEAIIPANGNASEAARMAGLKHPGQQGHRLLKNVEIQEAVEERLEAAKKCMGADDVLEHLTDVGEAAWREFCEVQYDRDDPEQVWQVKMRLTDKLKALELLGKYHKLFVDRVERSTEENETERAKADALTSVAASLEKMAARKQAPA